MGGNQQTLARDNSFVGEIIVDEVSGYAEMQPRDVAGFDQLRAACLAVYADCRDRAASAGKKSYLRPVLQPDDFDAHPAIVRYALDLELLDAAERYLGAPPVLRSVQLFWTAPNESVAGSQMFHFDHIGQRQLKLFAYMNDVDDAEGPFSFLPADLSARVQTEAQANGGRYRDEDVFAVCSAEDLVVLKGAAGSGGLVDTTRCLHFGGRARGGERLMAIIQYVRPEDDFSPEGMVRPRYPDLPSLSPRQKSALRSGAGSR